MKATLLSLLALPLLLTGCASYVGYDGYGYGPSYYDGVYGDVAVYGYDRGGYHAHYHHYDGSYHGAVASRGFARGSTHVASASHSGGGNAGGGGHAAASAGGAGGGGFGGGGGHR
jgi:hypothetical protein